MRTILTDNPVLFFTLSGKKLESLLHLAGGSFPSMVETFFIISEGKLQYEAEFKRKNYDTYGVANVLAASGMVID